jgi:hypothetical protein
VVGAGEVAFVVDVGAAGTVSAAGSVVDVRAGVDPPPPQPAASNAPPTTTATACPRIDPVSRHLTHLPHPIIRPHSQRALKLHRLQPKAAHFWQYIIKSWQIGPSDAACRSSSPHPDFDPRGDQ